MKTQRNIMRVGWRIGLCMVAVCLVAPSVVADSLKPIVLDPSYSHDRFGTMPKDIVHGFRAYTTSFDSADDNDGNGTPDRWGIPEWVAYEIKALPPGTTLGGGPNRPKWMTDAELFAEGVAHSDASYHFSNVWRDANPNSDQLGYDRGHMCMKHHAWRLGANADWNTHTVLNACPQRSKLNQGIWLDLEKRTATWADKYGSVWIIAGPVVFNDKPSK